ncbi:MAG: ribose 5-phosphate isomerase B [Clostridiales bacterium]|nr:MAG: ribose 5-phosphate isomerase B [Clostridiales bacterium]
MIAIASDHAGYELKEKIKNYLSENNIDFEDFGTNNTDSCDYPVFAKNLCASIQEGKCEKGILVCGTGIGMSMVANKQKGIRAAACSDYFSAKFTRMHNDANVLCIGARVLGEGLADELVEVFINTEFEGGKHQRRIDMFE